MSRKLVISLCMSAALLLPAVPAQAAVTFGSDLTGTPAAGTPCPSTTTAACMLAMTSLPGRMMAAPTDGVIVRWRVKGNSSANPVDMTLRVIRPSGGGSFTAINTSPTATFPMTVLDTTITPATQQPVKAGDVIAVVVQPPSNNFEFQTGITQVGLNIARWQPPLADGSTSPPTLPPQNDTAELLYNAELEPDADCDGLGDETQDPQVVPGGCSPAAPAAAPLAALASLAGGVVKTKGKTISLMLSCPAGGGPCSGNGVSLRSAKPVNAGRAAAAKAKRIAVGSASFSIPAGASQAVGVRLTKRARTVLLQRRKLATKATITGAGRSTTASLTIKLK
jgi:hypothetical protein